MSGTAPNQLLIATRNSGKLREFQQLLAGLPFQLRNLNDVEAATEPEENGTTFTANAILKAKSYAEQTGFYVLADDSGLEVEALGGAPGVVSARYAGEGATDEQRTRKLLEELSRTGDIERRARFVCVIAITDPQGNTLKTFSGMCEGHIAYEPRGANGFGYDPVFVPDGYEESFGELSPDVKHEISHRARALRAAWDFLLDGFQ